MRGYQEEGTITTAFDTTVLNDLDCLSQTGDKGLALNRRLNDRLFEHRRRIRLHGQDMPEIRNWRWGASK